MIFIYLFCLLGTFVRKTMLLLSFILSINIEILYPKGILPLMPKAFKKSHGFSILKKIG